MPLAARTWPPAASHCSCALSSCPLDRTGSSPVQGRWWSAATEHPSVRHRHAGCEDRLKAAQQRSCGGGLLICSNRALSSQAKACRVWGQAEGSTAALLWARTAGLQTRRRQHFGMGMLVCEQLHSASAHGVTHAEHLHQYACGIAAEVTVPLSKEPCPLRCPLRCDRNTCLRVAGQSERVFGLYS